MHHLRYTQYLQLALVVAGVSCPTDGWSADKPTSTRSKEIRQVASSQADASNAAPAVVPASFSSMGQWRDSAVDRYEAHSPQRPQQTHHSIVYQLGKDLREVRDWFCYIKGNGPAIWVPRDMCRRQGYGYPKPQGSF